jgi:adenine deaminase
MHGGVAVASEGKVLAEWAAPVAGLYGMGPASQVVSEVAAADGALSAFGCRWPNPILSLEVLTTAAIRFLRISPAGYRRLRDGAQLGLEWEP